MSQVVSHTEDLEVSQRVKETLLYIGTNLKGDRLKVPDDPGCEPDEGLEVSQRAKENLIYIDTNLIGDRLKVPDGPSCESYEGPRCVPEAKGEMTLYCH